MVIVDLLPKGHPLQSESSRKATINGSLADTTAARCHLSPDDMLKNGHFYEDVEQSISLGRPLSPLMGALFLDLLDKRMEKLGLFYVRFMDDWVVLAPSRWKLRRAVRIVNETLAELKVQQHPDKTFIGRLNHGFDFLGYHLSPQGLTVASGTMRRFVERVRQLYAQGADAVRIGDYVRRWQCWANAGLALPNRLTDYSTARVRRHLADYIAFFADVDNKTTTSLRLPVPATRVPALARVRHRLA